MGAVACLKTLSGRAGWPFWPSEKGFASSFPIFQKIEKAKASASCDRHQARAEPQPQPQPDQQPEPDLELARGAGAGARARARAGAVAAAGAAAGAPGRAMVSLGVVLGFVACVRSDMYDLPMPHLLPMQPLPPGLEPQRMRSSWRFTVPRLGVPTPLAS